MVGETQAQKYKNLQDENARLRKQIADLSAKEDPTAKKQAKAEKKAKKKEERRRLKEALELARTEHADAQKKLRAAMDYAKTEAAKLAEAQKSLAKAAGKGKGKGNKTEVWVEVSGRLAGTNGDWLQVELEEGQRMRIVQPHARGKYGAPSSTGGSSGSGFGTKDQGPVFFERFDYPTMEDLDAQVQKAGEPEWITVPAATTVSHPRVKKTRIVQNLGGSNQVILASATAGQGQQVKTANYDGANLTNNYG